MLRYAGGMQMVEGQGATNQLLQARELCTYLLEYVGMCVFSYHTMFANHNIGQQHK
jgi:hypothetical protein